VSAAARRGAATVREKLAELPHLSLNFDLPGPEGVSSAQGWHIDDFRVSLPPESPGEPLSRGSWSIARKIVHDYEFADPALVRAIYYTNADLADTEILLDARFCGLRFLLECRVGEIVDETRVLDGRRVRVWGWNYRTLQGHLEEGQMDYEVRKDLTNGAVDFHIHAYSRRAPIPNRLIRLGFVLFGRRSQLKFMRSACHRTADFTTQRLAGKTPSAPMPFRHLPQRT
jgi:uncharacterized protein (UPF0548 family)